MAFDSCDLGTFEELKEKVSEFKPHIVHLTGHGAVLDGQGHFAFEKEDGTADLVPSEELRRFLAGSGVQCVFVSGCQSGKAPREALAGICQSLVGAEVPLAVGWAASIADDLATNFASTFYRTLKDAPAGGQGSSPGPPGGLEGLRGARRSILDPARALFCHESDPDLRSQQATGSLDPAEHGSGCPARHEGGLCRALSWAAGASSRGFCPNCAAEICRS